MNKISTQLGQDAVVRKISRTYPLAKWYIGSSICAAFFHVSKGIGLVSTQSRNQDKWNIPNIPCIIICNHKTQDKAKPTHGLKKPPHSRWRCPCPSPGLKQDSKCKERKTELTHDWLTDSNLYNCKLKERVWRTDNRGNNKTNEWACYGTQNNIHRNKPPT